MVREALDKKGGVKYLVEQADANPKAFLALVAKLMPANVNMTMSVDPVMLETLQARRKELAQRREQIIEHRDAAE